MPYERNLRNILLVAIAAGIFLILLMPLIVNAPPLIPTYFPFIVGKALFFRMMVEIIFGLWLVLIFRFPEFRLPRSWLVTILGIYLLAALLAAFFGVSFTRSFWSTYERMEGVFNLLHWFAFVLVVASVVRQLKYWRWLLNANLAVGLFVAFVGIAQFYGVKVVPYIEQKIRIDSTLGNPVYVGAVMAVNIMMALALLAHTFESGRTAEAEDAKAGKKRRRPQRAEPEGIPLVWLQRIFYAVVIGTDLYALVLAGARGAYFGLAAALIAFTVAYILRGRIKLVRLAGLAAVTVLALTGILLAVGIDSRFVRQTLAPKVPLVQEMVNFTSPETSVTKRWTAVRMALRGFTDKPVFGWGPENFSVVYDRYVPATAFERGPEYFDEPHSKPVEELATKGIVGFIPYMLLWAVMLWWLIRVLRNRMVPAQLFMMLMGAALVGYFVQNLNLFDTPATSLQYYLLVGFMVSLEVNLHKEPAVSGVAVAESPEMTSRLGKDARPGKAKVVKTEDIPASGLADRVRAWLDGQGMPPGIELAPVIVLLIPMVMWLNFRPYHAADLVLDAFTGVEQHTGRTVELDERLRIFDASIATSPPLANYLREPLLNFYAGLPWQQMDEETAARLKAEADQQFRDAVEAEPQHWRMHIAVANLYHGLAVRDPSYIQKAREYVNKAHELAPTRIEVERMRTLQCLLEQDVACARKIVDDYLEAVPTAELFFRDLKQYIEQAEQRANPSQGASEATSAP
jgi:O-antigen ligase